MDAKLAEVLTHEGVVTIITWTEGSEPNAVGTWNSYIHVDAAERLLIPVAGMTVAQQNLAVNDRIILMLGAREVEGFNGYQGTGFNIQGTAVVEESGPAWDVIHADFPWAKKALVVTVASARQLL